MTPRPCYVIRKTDRRRWNLFLDVPGSLLMQRLGSFPSRSAAMTTARLLAGRHAEVLVERS